MLTLTEAAGSYLTNLLEQNNAPDESAVRLVVQSNQASLALDKPADKDETFDHNGRTVLLLDEQAAQALSEKTLDVTETQDGKALQLQ